MSKSRVTAVQVPGEEPAHQENDLLNEQNAEQSSEVPESATNEIQSEQAPTVDVDALREQIRAEEQAKLRTELQQQASAATAVAKAPAKRTTVAMSRGAYKDMHAHEIDASTLTAPVMTKDGWLCPPPHEEKK